MSIYITGDTHRDFYRISDFCDVYGTTTDDILIILGDSGINYYLDERDRELKKVVSKLPITLLCIHGNHEQRASNISSYNEVERFGSYVYVEKEYPNILFTAMADCLLIGGKTFVVAGGAYSVDKDYRLYRRLPYWYDEQMNEQEYEMAEMVCKTLAKVGTKPIMLTHTCPESYIPTEAFLPGIDDSTVDHKTEARLEKIRQATEYEKWYCGHFHIDKEIDDIVFMHEDIRQII